MPIKNITGVISFKFIAVLALVLAIGFSLFVYSLPTGRSPQPGEYRDAQRISALNQIRLGLERYADEHNTQFPPLSGSCISIEGLQHYLVPRYLAELPEGPSELRVAIAPDRNDYVVKATFELKNSVALTDDIDGVVFGCNCEDPNYCVGP